MERTGVIVENGVVINTILWNDQTPSQLSDDGFEHYEEITNFEVKPGIGWTWSEVEGYRRPKPHESWIWKDGDWAAPKAMPKTGGPYQWDEETLSWVAVPAE